MLTPFPISTSLRAVGRLAAVLGLAAALSTATLAVLTRAHPGVHRTATEWRAGPMPALEGAAEGSGGMQTTESSSDLRTSGSGTP